MQFKNIIYGIGVAAVLGAGVFVLGVAPGSVHAQTASGGSPAERYTAECRNAQLHIDDLYEQVTYTQEVVYHYEDERLELFRQHRSDGALLYEEFEAVRTLIREAEAKEQEYKDRHYQPFMDAVYWGKEAEKLQVDIDAGNASTTPMLEHKMRSYQAKRDAAGAEADKWMDAITAQREVLVPLDETYREIVEENRLQQRAFRVAIDNNLELLREAERTHDRVKLEWEQASTETIIICDR